VCVVSDEVEVKNGIYGKDAVLGCGLPDDGSAELTFKWLKDGNEVQADSHRAIAVQHDTDHNYTLSTLTVKDIGNCKTCSLYFC